jgi:membrane fusion protein, protease secretion system
MAFDLSKKLTQVPQTQSVQDVVEVPGPGGPPRPAANDTGRPTRFGVWALFLGFGGFLLWAAFAPLDEGVPSTGQVAIDTKRKSVQHLTGGIIKDVLVREGDKVKEGQLLVKLDEASTRAQYETARQRYLGYRAVQGRLQAEQIGSAAIKFHPDLVQAGAQDPLIRAQMQTQEQLFRSRRAALEADLQAFEESIRGQNSLIESYRGMLESRRGALALLTEELNNTRGLVKDGYAPRNRQLELERMVAESNASLAELQGNAMR